MKKLCILLCLCLLLSGCSDEPDPLELVSDELGADVTSGTLVNYDGSHGEFHGDGVTALQIVIPSLSVPEGPNWHPLPLSENLSRALYGKSGDGYRHAPLFTDEQGDPLLPRIESGCWFFLDRHSQSTDSSDDTDLFSRYSWNFTVAVYDSAAGILYFFRLDT